MQLFPAACHSVHTLFSSAPCSQTRSIYVLPKSPVYTKQAKLQFLLIFMPFARSKVNCTVVCYVLTYRQPSLDYVKWNGRAIMMNCETF